MAWDTDLLRRGYDLANPKLLSEVVGPELAEAAAPAFSVADAAGNTIREVYQRLASAVPEDLATVGSTIAVAADVILAAKGILEQASKRWAEESTRHEIEARDFLFAQRRDSDWRSRFKITGPKPSDLDLKDSPGGWKGKQFLAQYKPPGVIFMRVAGARDFVVATFPTWAEESQQGNISDGGLLPDLLAQGAKERPGLLDRRAAIPAVPEKYGWNYLCAAPRADAGDGNVIERVVSNQRCAPVPGSELALSWGTYPFIGANGEPWPLGPKGVAGCLAMQALTPVWANVRESEVEKAYRHWLKFSRLREFPRNVSRQLEPYEMVLDSDLLPFCNQEFAVTPFHHTLPVVNVWPTRWRAIELSFRRFFALREMAIRQPELLPAAISSAVAANPDFKRKPRANYTWADPLGDGWLGGNRVGRTSAQERAGRTPAQEEAARQEQAKRRWLFAGGAAVTATAAGFIYRRARRG